MQDKQLGMLIAKMRVERDISAKLLTYGICSQSFLNAVEAGRKDIDGFMLDYIFERLGVSQDGYEYYQPKHKIKSIIQRDNIIRLIENQELVKAEQELYAYKKNYWNKNNLHKQFILHMESRLLILNENDYKLAYDKLRQALIHTVPEIGKNKLFRLLIGFNELFLLVECIRLKLKLYNDLSIYNEYEEIIEYIKISGWEDLLKIRIYNKVVCLLSEYWLIKKEYEKILNHCNQAIKYIQNTGKIYFVSNILKFKIRSLEGLINYKDNSLNKNSYNLIELNNEHRTTVEWKNMIDDLLQEYGALVEPYEWQSYYNSKEIYFIGNVIKRRRKMLRQSHDQLSDGICEILTLSKIEKGIQAPRPKTAKSLLKKLIISNELYNTDIVSDDYELHNLFNEINSLLNLRKYDEAKKLLDVLGEKLDTSNPINKQYFMQKKTSALKNLNMISKEEAIKSYEEALHITLPKKLDLKAPYNYFTKREILLMISIAIVAEELGYNDKALGYYEVLESYFNNSCVDIKNRIVSYEIFATNYESFLGNQELFQKSNEINQQIVTKCLELRRSSSISDLLYSQAYNMKKLIEQKREMQDFEKDLYMEKLKKSYTIACIMNDEFSIDFINSNMIE